jgi:hypothetical protein
VGGQSRSQADKVTVSIRDAAGKLVQTRAWAQPAGVLNFVGMAVRCGNHCLRQVRLVLKPLWG